MGKIISAEPVKLFTGIIALNTALFQTAEARLIELFGPVDLKTSEQGIPFTFTDYYESEMGSNLKRFFVSFKKSIRPDQLAGIKVKINLIEESIAAAVKSKAARPVNLDPGYLTASKVILATTKDYAHRIYLQKGIYAEITLQYRSSKTAVRTPGFQPMPWTYPDYCTKEYLDFFERLRKIHLSCNRK